MERPHPTEFMDAERATQLYRVRFDEAAQRRGDAIWRVLCTHFFQRYVPEDGTVVDLGAGHCEFINHIRAARRIAVDINPETQQRAAPGVEVVARDIRALDALPQASADVVFASNVLEHLPTKSDVMSVLAGAHRLLRPAGKLIIMGPNIRFAAGEYWDFLDHHIPLSERSVREALEIAGYTVREVRPRFLPLSRLSRTPQHPALVRLYLALPLAHRVMGKQFLIVALR